MLGILTSDQIEHVLRSQIIGRIGCSANGKVYVVPVTYVFHNGYIYAHSREGLKVKMMRKNPKVCFQADSIDSMTNWRSVILWGTFQELETPKEQKAALTLLHDRLSPFITSETVRPQSIRPDQKMIEKELKAVAFRIKIDESSGRFEKN